MTLSRQTKLTEEERHGLSMRIVEKLDAQGVLIKDAETVKKITVSYLENYLAASAVLTDEFDLVSKRVGSAYPQK